MTRYDRSSTMPSGAEPLRPISVRVSEACRLTGIGRSKLYELIAAGEIEIVKVGTMTLLPVDALTAFIEQRRKAAPNPSMSAAGEQPA